MIVVVKIGTSSITDEDGEIDSAAIAKLCSEVAEIRSVGNRVIVVTSGAIGAGLPALGLGGPNRPRDAVTLQAVSAVGQSRLMHVYGEELGSHGLVCGQVLLAPLDFFDRRQYLHARGTIERLLDLGVVPIVNENDAIADDEIRFGDNDRLAALMAHLIKADVLVMLTDTPGLFTADPRIDPNGSLIEEIVEVDQELEALAGGAGSVRGSGGMASKLSAAKIAAWSGIRTIIAAAHRENVLVDAVAAASGIDGQAGTDAVSTDAVSTESARTEAVGTVVLPRDRHLSARKLWIAFAVGSSGLLTVDPGARSALLGGAASLLAAGVTGVDGDFAAGDAVEIVGPDGEVFAKGLCRVDSNAVRGLVGKHSDEIDDGPAWLVHRDDLVALP